MDLAKTMGKPYKNITKEDIKKAVDYVFNQKPKPDPNKRVVRFATYCKGRSGPRWFSAENPNLCGDPECKNCRKFEDIYKEVAEEWANDTLENYPLDFKEIVAWETQENLTAKEVIEKYGHILTEQEIEQLKKYE